MEFVASLVARGSIVVGVLLVVGGLLVAPFAVGIGTPREPVQVTFEDTVTTGLPAPVTARASGSPLVIPKAKAFFSEFRYPVGYYGISSMVPDARPGGSRELGQFLGAYVSDFADRDVTVSERGLLQLPETQPVGWVTARNAHYVVDSEARLPGRTTVVVPFSQRADAVAFAEEYGGHVVDWETIRRRQFEDPGRSPTAWHRTVEDRQQTATTTASNLRVLLERPPSITVGEDVQNLQAVVDRAPPESTVVVPPGRYRVGELHIEKPLTIRGAGRNQTRIVGDGNGSVVFASSDGIALANMSIAGVGEVRTGNDRSNLDIPVDRDAWDYGMWKTHGYGDAAVVIDDVNQTVIRNVTVETSANGILVRQSTDVLVENVRLYGSRTWREGFLGIGVLGSRAIVQNATMYGGKVGVFAHDAPGLVIRNSRMEGMMVGVFPLFTTGATVAGNAILDTWVGVHVDTRATGTALVGNRLRGNRYGLFVKGATNYVARNTMVHNRIGAGVGGSNSLYTRNVLAFNRIGMEGLTLLPTNEVTRNDFIGNRRHAATSEHDVLHVWTVEGTGNYWSNAPGIDRDGNGRLDRPYRPTGVVERWAHRRYVARILTRSPALTGIRSFQRVAPGLRADGIVDTAPLLEPERARVVDRLRIRHDTGRQRHDDDDWEYRPGGG